jgi:pyruvate/2-oxoglutarate dehydrogenase complex dihydrolipoamide acyltransferase (E2) component
MSESGIARQRRHTLYFLNEIRSFAPVFLDTEVDVSRLRGAPRHSMVTHVLYSAARVLAKHPEANAAIQGRLRPKVARYPFVNGKVALDKVLDGQRVVLATVVPNVHELSRAEIQRHVDRVRDGDPAQLPDFAGIRALHSMHPLRALIRFRRAARSLRIRPMLTGTFAVTSLGHRAVDSFHSVGGTTITLGIGRILDRPVVRDGSVVVAPVMRLSLTFDHRVIDGAEAADILTEIKESLENPDLEPMTP